MVTRNAQVSWTRAIKKHMYETRFTVMRCIKVSYKKRINKTDLQSKKATRLNAKCSKKLLKYQYVGIFLIPVLIPA